MAKFIAAVTGTIAVCSAAGYWFWLDEPKPESAPNVVVAALPVRPAPPIAMPAAESPAVSNVPAAPASNAVPGRGDVAPPTVPAPKPDDVALAESIAAHTPPATPVPADEEPADSRTATPGDAVGSAKDEDDRPPAERF